MVRGAAREGDQAGADVGFVGGECHPVLEAVLADRRLGTRFDKPQAGDTGAVETPAPAGLIGPEQSNDTAAHGLAQELRGGVT